LRTDKDVPQSDGSMQRITSISDYKAVSEICITYMLIQKNNKEIIKAYHRMSNSSNAGM
jgi:hypothetical protein